MKPVADADRATLCRRVYFDLIGLPPTPEQIDAFTNDTSPDAYARLVDQLLASPHFGERWGRHWLDVVRFGESVTLRGITLPGAWRFRYYVIDSFNQDRPFNVLLEEHVAGDLMLFTSVAQHRRQLVGTIFLVMGNANLEEQDKQQLRMDVVDEQLDTIGKAFLGQTIGCARCHDHKFDPIPTADYYAMAGILRNAKAMEHANVSKVVTVPLPEEPAVLAQFLQRQSREKEIQAQLDRLTAGQPHPTLTTRFVRDVDKTRGKPQVVAVKDLPGIVIDDLAAKKVGEWKHSTSVATYIGDGYIHDDNSGKGEKTLTFQPEIPKTGHYEVRLSYMPGKSRARNVPVNILSEDGEKTIEVDERQTPNVDGRFTSLGVFRFVKDGQGYVQISTENTSGFVVADAVQFLPIDDTADHAPTTGPMDGEIRKLRDELKQLELSGPKPSVIVSVVEESQIGDTQIHLRGNPHTLGATVPRGFLSCVSLKSVPTIPPNESGRLQLGQWLASPENPLPARVMANRVWHWLTGEGIVRTVDNFGTTGEQPSHPELLDYLAKRFVDEGWSVKKLVREIVLSRAYQLASTDDAHDAAIDPENRMRWRADRRRLDAECLRDAMLSVAGTLDLSTAGGALNGEKMESDYGYKYEGNRRSVYIPVLRNAMPEIFDVFDFADPSSVVGRRTTSTVAPQALFMLNHPFPKQQAAAAATKLLAEPGLNDAQRLTRATRLALGREPTAGERRILLEAVKSSSSDPQAAWSRVFHALFASPDFQNVD